MAENYGTAGYYSLEEFRIISLTENLEAELKNLVYKFNIKESMARGYLSGSADIYDSAGVLYDFPIKGEELLVIRYKDFFKKEHRDEMVIYNVQKIEDTKNGSDVLIHYTINFVSVDKFVTDAIELQRGFNNLRIDEMVSTIFDDYYKNGNPKKELLEVVETEGKHTLIIPKYSPTSAMEFLTRRAVTSGFTKDTQTVRFFETRKGFFFTTHDDLNSDFTNGIPNKSEELKYQYSSIASFGGEGGNLHQLRYMQEILDFEFPEHVHTIRDMTHGGYRRRVTQLDFINRSYLPEDYDHLDFIEEYTLPDGTGQTEVIHGSDFTDKYLTNREEVIVLKALKSP